MEDPIAIKFKIPRQDLPALSLFEPECRGCQKLGSEPTTSPMARAAGQITRSSALNDLNRTPLSPEVRYSIMEVLRPKIDEAQSALSKRFLNQPLVMPEGVASQQLTSATGCSP